MSSMQEHHRVRGTFFESSGNMSSYKRWHGESERVGYLPPKRNSDSKLPAQVKVAPGFCWSISSLFPLVHWSNIRFPIIEQ